MPDRVSVASADFIRNIGYWQSEALRRPISITHHGRERLVLAAPDFFTRLEGANATAPTQPTAAARADEVSLHANLGDSYFAFDAHMTIRDTNALGEAFAGMRRDDLVGARISSTLPQPLASILSDRVQRVIRTKQTERFDAGAPEDRHYVVTVFPVSVGAAALLRNVTETHALRERLEDGEAMQQAVNCHTLTAAIRLDARARIESVDATFGERTGFTTEDLTGHRVIDLVPVPNRREVGEAIERVLRDGRALEIRSKLLTKRGEEIAGVLSLAPILTDFTAHGVIALFVPIERNGSAQQAA